jgi:hypothetical protein
MKQGAIVNEVGRHATHYQQELEETNQKPSYCTRRDFSNVGGRKHGSSSKTNAFYESVFAFNTCTESHQILETSSKDLPANVKHRILTVRKGLHESTDETCYCNSKKSGFSSLSISTRAGQQRSKYCSCLHRGDEIARKICNCTREFVV